MGQKGISFFFLRLFLFPYRGFECELMGAPFSEIKRINSLHFDLKAINFFTLASAFQYSSFKNPNGRNDNWFSKRAFRRQNGNYETLVCMRPSCLYHPQPLLGSLVMQLVCKHRSIMYASPSTVIGIVSYATRMQTSFNNKENSITTVRKK